MTLIFSVFHLLLPLVNAQRIPPTHGVNAWYSRADYLYNLENPTEQTDKESLELFMQIAQLPENPIWNRRRIESMIKAGNIHQGYGRFDDANKLYHRVLIENNSLDKLPEYNYEAYLYLGSSMYFNGILDSAKIYFENSAEISLTHRRMIDLPEQDRLYNSLGAIYFESADYNQATSFFQTALELAAPRVEDYNYYYSSIRSNIASSLIKMKYYDSAIKILQSIEGKANRSDIVFQPLANAYFEKGEYQTALKIFNIISLKSYLQKRNVLNYIGRIHIKLENWLEAERTFDSAITLQNQQPYRVKNKEEALTHLYRSELALKLGKINEAIDWVNNALNEVHLDFKSNSKYDLPKDISNTVSPITLYQILTFKAALIYKVYENNKESEALNAALDTYILSFKTVNYIARNFDNDDAKLFLIGTAKKDYEKAMEIAYRAVQINPQKTPQYLYILESYKGTVLRQNIEFNTLKQISGIPEKLIKRERELKQFYAGYLTKLNLAENEKDSRMLQNRLSEIRLELSNLQNSYKEYPLFTRFNETDQFTTPIKTIQKELDNETALLNYFVGEENIYLLAITRVSVKVHKSEYSDEFKSAFRSFISSSLNLAEGVRYKGYEAGFKIFQTLLEPVYSGISNFNKLIIIPDGNLFYLPFDALDRSIGEKDFLVRSHAISTHYSISLLRQHNAFNQRSGKLGSVIAFAPFAFQNDIISSSNFEILPFSAQEIAHPKSVTFVGKEATKQHFLDSYNTSRILHLATHASLGKDSSSNWIQFFPYLDTPDSGKLFVHEIYNLNLSENDLVILSACESGAGLPARGEGLLSLSRAFMYAGSKGIVSTLYKTDDRVTAILMKQFYFYLEKGYEPAVALQKSKIDLLNSNEINARFKSPNYWGNFIYIGKVSTYDEKKSYLWILVLLMLMIMILLAITVTNTFKKKNGLPKPLHLG